MKEAGELIGYILIGICLVVFLVLPLAMLLRVISEYLHRRRRHDQ